MAYGRAKPRLPSAMEMNTAHPHLSRPTEQAWLVSFSVCPDPVVIFSFWLYVP